MTGSVAAVDADDERRSADDAHLSDHLARIVQDGYTVLDGVIEDRLVGELASALDRLDDTDPAATPPSSFEGRRTTRHYNVLAKDATFAAAPTHPAVLDLVERLLDDGCQLSSMSTISIGPGEAPQPIHADDLAVRLPRPFPVPLVVTAMWALDDFTAENGATRVVPGSHRRDHVPDLARATDEPTGSERPVAMTRGSVLVYVGSLWHGGGANRTEGHRRALAVSYCAGWVRPQENQLVGVPHELTATFPDRLRVLLGWGIYHSQMGHIDKRRPANLVLGPGPDGIAADAPSWDGPVTTPLFRLDR